jgi:membrane-associated phospholipid phosphatase
MKSKKSKKSKKSERQLRTQRIIMQFPLFFCISCFIMWCVTGDIEFGKFVVLFVTISILIKILKRGVLSIFGNSGWVKRPRGAANCKYVLMPGNPKATSIGMPSGHSIAGACMACYGILMIWKSPKIKMEHHWKVLSSIFIGFIGLLIALGRTNIMYIGVGCHTVLQVLVGTVIGTLFGFVGYFVLHPKQSF